MLFGKRKLPYLDLMGDIGTIGLHLVASTFIGLAMGYYLDKWLDTDPWLKLAFLMLGIVAGFRNVYHEAMRIQKRESKRQEDGRHGR
jgi:ATP synthase protein I